MQFSPPRGEEGKHNPQNSKKKMRQVKRVKPFLLNLVVIFHSLYAEGFEFWVSLIPVIPSTATGKAPLNHADKEWDCVIYNHNQLFTTGWYVALPRFRFFVCIKNRFILYH